MQAALEEVLRHLEPCLALAPAPAARPLENRLDALRRERASGSPPIQPHLRHDASEPDGRGTAGSFASLACTREEPQHAYLDDCYAPAVENRLTYA